MLDPHSYNFHSNYASIIHYCYYNSLRCFISDTTSIHSQLIKWTFHYRTKKNGIKWNSWRLLSVWSSLRYALIRRVVLLFAYHVDCTVLREAHWRYFTFLFRYPTPGYLGRENWVSFRENAIYTGTVIWMRSLTDSLHWFLVNKYINFFNLGVNQIFM